MGVTLHIMFRHTLIFSQKQFKVMVQDILTGKYVVLRLLPYNKVHSALKQWSVEDPL